MGFLDNFKEAMKRGQEAAQNYREREIANQAQSGARTGAPAGAAAQGKHAPRQQAPLPEGMVNLGFSENIVITDPASGQPVTLHLLVNGRAIPMDPGMFQGQDFAAISKEAVLETVREKVNDPSYISNTKDVRTMMMASHHLQPIVLQALQGRGIKAGFKLMTLTVAQQ